MNANASVVVAQNGSSTHDDDDDKATFVYDEQGALWYVIAVMLVYSASMFFLIATFVKRKSANKLVDVEVERFLKGLDEARLQAKREKVLRVRLQWPGNFISPRQGGRTERSAPAAAAAVASGDGADAGVVVPEIVIDDVRQAGGHPECAESSSCSEATEGGDVYDRLDDLGDISGDLSSAGRLQSRLYGSVSSVDQSIVDLIGNDSTTNDYRLSSTSEADDEGSVSETGALIRTPSSAGEKDEFSSRPSRPSHVQKAYTACDGRRRLSTCSSRSCDDVNLSDVEGNDVTYDADTEL